MYIFSSALFLKQICSNALCPTFRDVEDWGYCIQCGCKTSCSVCLLALVVLHLCWGFFVCSFVSSFLGFFTPNEVP